MVAIQPVCIPDKVHLPSGNMNIDSPVFCSNRLDENSTSDDDSTTSDENDESSRARVDNSHASLESSSLLVRRKSSLKSSDSRRGNGSVVFLNVHTRVFESIEEDEEEDRKRDGLNGVTILDDNDFLDTIRNSAKWRFTDSVSDVETHLSQKENRRKEKNEDKIKGHILRAEQRKIRDIERDFDRQGKEKKKNGFKSKYLKPLWKGFIEASGKSAFIISPMQYQY